jgi:outer membrane protein assembly factor BamB
MPAAQQIVRAMVALSASAACAAAADWPTLAGGPTRVAVADAAPVSLAETSWIFSQTPSGPFKPVGQSGVVTGGGMVFAAGEVDGAATVVAIDQDTGAFAWSASVPDPAFESWSTPTYDARTGVLYVASGRRVIAIGASDGVELWRSPLLAGDVVNATPVVTGDLGDANRLFIADSSGFGGGGRLYCVNIDPRHLTLNPYDRGEIVWEFDLGQTAGSTAAYADGVVYVATAGDGAGRPPGFLFALPAGVSASPNPLWATPNPVPEGFYGGVCVTASGGTPVLYAASYAFYGSLMAGNLVKVRAETGEVVWSIPANRTASIPVPLGDGRILLSAGLQGFGTVPSVQLFRDNGASAHLLWDSALWTWQDLNGNGWLDPGEFTPMGGWTHQPAAAKAGPRQVAVFGTIADGGFGPYGRLRVVDLKHPPGHPSFILGEAPAGGSTPALDDGDVYSIGAEGVVAYLTPECHADCDGSGAVDFLDLVCFQAAFAAGDPKADCDGTGSLNFFDFLCFLTAFGEGC